MEFGETVDMGSADTSISDLVTIIVKAPNQQIADQTIQCSLSWSIKKLKNYLSEVYPSKPKLEEQKLIYSGKLLTDSAVLKDILRTFEGQENHTVHLVCTTKSQKYNKMAPNVNSSNFTRNENSGANVNYSESYRNASQSRITDQVMGNTGSAPISGTPGPLFDQLNVSQFPANNFDSRYFWPSATAFVNISDVDVVNQQFAYMQQAYAQYISQYMQMMGQPGLGYVTSHIPQPVSVTSQTLPVPNNNNGLVRDRVNYERNQVRDIQGVVGNDIDEEEGRNNRDWLDVFFSVGRLMVLFTIVYFYSTPLRLLAVLLLVCMFYLHQNMRLQNDHLNLNLINNNNNDVINHNNQNNENRAVAPAPVVIPENLNADGVRQRRSQEQTNSVNINETTPHSSTEQSTISMEPAAPAIPERPSPITVTLLAIKTFFLSLVPDQPTM